MKKYLYIVILLFIGLNISAENIQFSATAPNVVANGKQFKLVYSLKNTTEKEIKLPEIKDFDVIMGPSVTTGKSIQIINGCFQSFRYKQCKLILLGKYCSG